MKTSHRIWRLLVKVKPQLRAIQQDYSARVLLMVSAEASLETSYIKLGDIFQESPQSYDHENTKIPKRFGIQTKVWNRDFSSSFRLCTSLQPYDKQLVRSLHDKVNIP